MPQDEKKLLLAGFHLSRFRGCGVFMFISEEMEEAVDEKKFHFIHESDTTRCGVANGRFGGQGDIPKEPGIDCSEFPFGHRERDDVG